MDTINKILDYTVQKNEDDFLLQCIKIIKEALIM